MITSNKQYDAAKKQLAMLTESLSSPVKKDVPDIIEQASRAQTQELIDEIQESIKEYEELRNSKPTDVEIHSLDDLLVAPIRYRIAAHMSVDEFGRKVGVNARQIARYELEGYKNINSSTFQKILKGLNIHLDGKVA
jgi:Helix-turn-helix